MKVVVIGDLLYDLLARLDGDVALGTDTFTEIKVSGGGSGANAAARWHGPHAGAAAGGRTCSMRRRARGRTPEDLTPCGAGSQLKPSQFSTEGFRSPLFRDIVNSWKLSRVSEFGEDAG
jgi:hypothetical protein